jgi:hypothetical protein
MEEHELRVTDVDAITEAALLIENCANALDSPACTG